MSYNFTCHFSDVNPQSASTPSPQLGSELSPRQPQGKRGRPKKANKSNLASLLDLNQVVSTETSQTKENDVSRTEVVTNESVASDMTTALDSSEGLISNAEDLNDIENIDIKVEINSEESEDEYDDYNDDNKDDLNDDDDNKDNLNDDNDNKDDLNDDIDNKDDLNDDNDKVSVQAWPESIENAAITKTSKLGIKQSYSDTALKRSSSSHSEDFAKRQRTSTLKKKTWTHDYQSDDLASGAEEIGDDNRDPDFEVQSEDDDETTMKKHERVDKGDISADPDLNRKLYIHF